MNNFILTYSPFLVSPTHGQVLNHVKFNRLVHSSYQPYAGTYLLKSDESAYALNESFRGFFEQTPYILMLYSAAHAGGQLPQEIWNWINYGSVPTSPYSADPAKPDALATALSDLGQGYRDLGQGYRKAPG